MTAYKTALFIIQHMLLFYVSRSLCAELLNSFTRIPPGVEGGGVRCTYMPYAWAAPQSAVQVDWRSAGRIGPAASARSYSTAAHRQTGSLCEKANSHTSDKRRQRREKKKTPQKTKTKHIIYSINKIWMNGYNSSSGLISIYADLKLRMYKICNNKKVSLSHI